MVATGFSEGGFSFGPGSFTTPESMENGGTEVSGLPETTEQQDNGNDSVRPAFDPSRNTGNNQSGMSWTAFGILAVILLAAILITARMPGKER